MKKQMKQVAAATLAALCFGAVAIPTVASAATINVTENVDNIDLSETTLTAYKVFGINVITEGSATITQVDGATVSAAVANVFKSKDVALTDAEIAATSAADKTTDANKALLASLAQKIGDYLSTLTDDSTATKALARALVDAVEDGTVFTAATDNGTATLSGLDAGYYLVTGTTVDDDGSKNETVYSSVMLKSSGTDEVINITLKSDKPTVDKNIVEGSALVDANTAGVGQTVNYQIDSKVPDHTYYATYYMKFTDTLSAGLDFVVNATNVENSAVVKIGSATLTAEQYELAISADGRTMTIEIDNIEDYTIGDAIVITYSAVVNEDAVVSDTAGNPNEVYLTYSNDPNWDTDGDGVPDSEDPNPETPSETPDEDTPDEPTEDTPPVEVITYLTKLVIHKVDETNTAMSGIQFTLTGQTHGVTYYVKEANGEYTVSSTAFDGATAGVTVETDADGNIVFSGLTADTYTISEVAAPEGYIKADDLAVKIVATFTDAENSTDAPAWTYNDSDSNEFTIVNKKGTTLPSTGGIGTTIFTIVGLTLMAAAAGAFIIKRKVTAQ